MGIKVQVRLHSENAPVAGINMSESDTLYDLLAKARVKYGDNELAVIAGNGVSLNLGMNIT